MKTLKIEIEQKDGVRSAILSNVKPLRDTPKCYKKLGVFRHNLGNAYNSDLITIYEVKNKGLRFSMYRDGCFYEYYGKIIIGELINK